MSGIHTLFFELMQIAVGNRAKLSRVPTAKEWSRLFAMSEKQALLGIAFVGVSRLNDEQKPDIDLLMEWIGQSEYLKTQNDDLNVKCREICRQLEEDGFTCCVLKGQSNLGNYRKLGKQGVMDSGNDLSDYRTCGDIDLWVVSQGDDECASFIDDYFFRFGKKEVIDYILRRSKQEGLDEPKVCYHHVEYEFKGVDTVENTDVEVHFRPSWMNCPLDNHRLQKWCTEQLQQGAIINGENGFPVPSNSFNAVYQLVHIYRHLFSEGIGLRQLLDYYAVLCIADANDIDNALGTIKRLHLEKFASAVLWVLETVFGTGTRKIFGTLSPSEERGRFLLNEIMLAGNFGKYDKRNKIKNDENDFHRFFRRQRRFMRFLTQYPREVIWGPYFTFMQRAYRVIHGWQ